MRVNGQANILGIGAHLDGQRYFRDELASTRTHDPRANHAPGLGIEQELGQSFVTAKGQRAATGRPWKHTFATP